MEKRPLFYKLAKLMQNAWMCTRNSALYYGLWKVGRLKLILGIISFVSTRMNDIFTETTEQFCGWYPHKLAANCCTLWAVDNGHTSPGPVLDAFCPGSFYFVSHIPYRTRLECCIIQTITIRKIQMMIRTMQMITGTIQTITIRQYKRNQTYTTIHQAQKPCWSSYRTRAN